MSPVLTARMWLYSFSCQLSPLLAPAQLLCRNLQLLSLPPHPAYTLSPTLFTQPAHKSLQHVLYHLLTTLHALPHCPPLSSHPAFITLPSALLSLYPCYETSQARDFLSLTLQLLQCLEESGAWPAGIVKRSHLQSAHGDKLTLVLLYFSTYTLHQQLRHFVPHSHTVPDFPYAAASSHTTADDAITAIKAQLVVSGDRTVRTIALQATELAEWKTAADALYETSKSVNGRLKAAREEEERLMKAVEPFMLSIDGEQQRATLAAATSDAYSHLQQLIQQCSTEGAVLADVSNRRWQPTTLRGSDLQQAAGSKQPLPTKAGQVDAAAVVRRWKDELKRVREAVREAVKQRAMIASAVTEVESRVSEQQQVSANTQRLQQQVQHALSTPAATPSRSPATAVSIERPSWVSLQRPLIRVNETPAAFVTPLAKLAELPLDDVANAVAPHITITDALMHASTSQSDAGLDESSQREDELCAAVLITPVKLAHVHGVPAAVSSGESPFGYESSAGLLDESIELIDQL